MSYISDHDFLVADAIREDVGVGRYDQASNSVPLGRLAGLGILQQEIDDGANTRLYVAGTRWMALRDLDEHPIKLACGGARKT